MGFIYALAERFSVEGNEQTEIRYIGATSFSVRGRLYWHLNTASRNRTLKERWINSVVSSGGEIVFLTLEECENHKLGEKEISYISDLRQCYDLLNSTSGGEGLNMSKESRAAIGAAARLDRISQIANGDQLAFHTPEARNKAIESLRDVKHTTESKRNFSLAAKKRFENPKERERLSKATKGLVKSPEHRERLAEATRAYLARAKKLICPVCHKELHAGPMGQHRKVSGH